MFSRKRQMTIGTNILNLSELFWTDEGGNDLAGRSAFVVMDGQVRGKDATREKFWHFLINCGDVSVEDSATGFQHYLAVVRKDGSYTLERLELYLEERGGDLVFDLWKLPDEMNGMKFNKMSDCMQKLTAGELGFRWQQGAFCVRDSGKTIWELEEKRGEIQ